MLESKGRYPNVTVAGDVALKTFGIDDLKNNPIVRLPLVAVSIAPTQPIAKVIHLAKISIQEPELNIGRTESGAITLESLIPKEPETKPVPGKITPQKEEIPVPLSLDIDEVQLTGGKITFTDLSKKPFKTILHPVELKVDHFSNGKEKKSNYALMIKTEANESVKVEGDLTMDPLRAEGGIRSAPFL